MILEGKPEFGDDLAKTKIRPHNTFGGKVIEILYGAKDAEGHAVAPKEGTEDGHGRWFGIEADGVYQMFVWQKPASEGGEIEYGTEYGDNAVEVMENQLLHKKELCREAEEIGKNSENDADEERLAAIRNELEDMINWQTPKDAEYVKRLGLAEEAFQRRIGYIRTNRKDKEDILKQAEALKEVTNFKEAKRAMRRLRSDLSEISSAGAQADEEFWDAFNKLDRDLRDRETEYFSNLDQRREEAKAIKEEIIAKARELTSGVTNWKDATAKLNGLFDSWKSAGSAGRDLDEELWPQFNELRQKFFEERQKFFDERNAQFKASVEKKNALIAEAKEIVEKSDLSKAITDRMKELDKEWRSAGYSGKEDNDRLWDEFTKIKDMFWGAKRDAANKRFQAQVDAKQAELDAARKQLEDLQYRLTLDVVPVLKEDLERNVYLKEEAIRKLEAELEELKARLN